ncbi:MAG: hypothetical protein U0175_27730 [Caldilineaceae bacterium]
MSILREQVQGIVAALFVERPGAKRSLAEWSDQLAADGRTIDNHVAAAKDAIKAQTVLRHMTGIERWGQQRLRVFLGQPLIVDEYDGYRTATNLSTEEQRVEFRKTRAETVEIVRKIAALKPDLTNKVLHNSFGPLTARGWLRYLDMHANLESKKIR